jgi:outer membrane murein-binding lipoprotein Lpp
MRIPFSEAAALADTARWLRRNVAHVVTWAVILFGVGVVWGSTSHTVGGLTDDVVELEAKVERATSERATLRSDVRVLEAQYKALDDSVRSVSATADRLKAITARLEALASRPYAPR